MIGLNEERSERLYLEKGKDEIYVESRPLHQHQIDGIRFLFRQFKMKKPGVIVNNPEGYGKTVQVALFLDAISKLLKHPVLILCKDDKEMDSWGKTLKHWTKYDTDEIAVESVNVYEKKRIFLKKVSDLTLYSRRDWAIMVVKSDFAPRALIRGNFNVSYKVWLTTIDMRKDLHMFNSVYGWLYSDKKFSMQCLLETETQYKGPLDRLKFLDAFLEDVVIMRNDFPTPYKSTQKEPLHCLPRITRKNKDATGTKIKRTKKPPQAEPTPMDEEKKNEQTIIKEGPTSVLDAVKFIAEFRISDDRKDKTKSDKQMDIESFIRDKDPVICNVYDFANSKTDVNSEDISFAEAAQDIVDNENEGENDPDSESVLTNLNLFDEVDSREELDAIEGASSDINLNIITKVKVQSPKANTEKDTVETKQESEQDDVLKSKVEVTDDVTDVLIPKANVADDFDVIHPSEACILDDPVLSPPKMDLIEEDFTIVHLAEASIGDDDRSRSPKMTDYGDISEYPIDANVEDFTVAHLATASIKEDEASELIQADTMIGEKDITVKLNTDVCELGPVKSDLDVIPTVDNKDKNKRSIDIQISEMEEKAVKKFKGTLLDTLF